MGFLLYSVIFLAVFVVVTRSSSGIILKAIMEARDVQHRMTPLSPWFFFNRAIRRKLPRWIGMVMLPLIVSTWTFCVFFSYEATIETMLYAFLFIVSMVITILSVVIIVAPYFHSPWALSLTGTLISIPVFIVIVVVVNKIVPARMNLFNSVFILISFLFSRSAWWFVRHRLNEKWFQFEGK